MSMYAISDSFDVRVASPSGWLTYESGHARTERQFLMSCINAEEFALRQIGKFFVAGQFESPVLPAPFPFDYQTDGPRKYGRLNMVARGFRIEPVCETCFNNDNGRGDDLIGDPVDIDIMEKYFWQAGHANEAENPDCVCRVYITYEENPCDCTTYDTVEGVWVTHPEILENTCIAVERNPAYELFTLPNTNLVWSALPAGPDRQLKADSYAFQLIPKADIIVYWHNIPTVSLCKIETHLQEFRQTVNNADWGGVLLCDDEASESFAEGLHCQNYEAETILFLDWQEDRSLRTDAFGGLNTGMEMNTTTLKLFFKQKRVVDPFTQNIVGWNHLFLDRSDENPANDQWSRVKIDKGDGNEADLFTLKSFTDIMNPSL